MHDGTIDCIATDHAPHAAHEKDREFDQAPFGIIGLETVLPVSLKLWSKPARFRCRNSIEKMTTAPRNILGLRGGTLEVGERADVTIFDRNEEVDFRRGNYWQSKSKNSPLAGQEMKGRVEATFVNGKRIL